jgi:hypothetical protein
MGTRRRQRGWEIPADIIPNAKPARCDRRHPVTVMERDRTFQAELCAFGATLRTNLAEQIADSQIVSDTGGAIHVGRRSHINPT